MSRYNKGALLRYAEPSVILITLGLLNFLLAVLSNILRKAFSGVQGGYLIRQSWLNAIVYRLGFFTNMFLIICILLIVAAVILHFILPDTIKICLMVKKRLLNPAYGNPLHFKDGEVLPKVTCKCVKPGIYEIEVTTISRTADEILAIPSSISASLRKKYSRYAVTQTEADIAYNTVCFQIEDVLADKSIKVHSVMGLMPEEPTKLIVQKETYIDLTTSGSMLIAGKTRSGKTTGIISILLQVLLAGRDNFGSEVIIIDPKQAELSRLPHVYTLDEDGEARGILDAMRHFADVIKARQKVLNDLSEKVGDAVKWWEVDMRPAFLFIDEYVSLRGIFPKRAGNKEDAEYSLGEFDAVIKRIATMGAAGGCFCILSIAEASVGEGGLPAMIQSACGTKVLFKPTLTEAKFLWDSDKLRTLPQRLYRAGNAWFSSTDGVHDNISYVHFPKMKFKVYRELGRLLEEYYKG